MTQHNIIGIDLAKSVFYLFEIDKNGKNIGRRKITRNKLLGRRAY
ncbi:hypothetical protein [Grimontia hollisae]|uniref:Transposase n=1 Tax=Grimontia hollisae CIP 101886 TaxID=675812 RepID=D0I6M6_GRIHO|nr:hypothetical protein [Grimontia hollisae]EEY72295.1 hypothetical protein VHA_001395 [Grimontia hollisae CIP 101886]STO45449.1 Uncharacterised protein [Grimontia hollisae]